MSDDPHPPRPNGTTRAREEPGVEETGFEFSDDPSIRRRNWWRMATGGLTEEGKWQYVRDRDNRNEQSDCEQCEKDRDFALNYSKPTIL